MVTDDVKRVPYSKTQANILFTLQIYAIHFLKKATVTE